MIVAVPKSSTYLLSINKTASGNASLSTFTQELVKVFELKVA